MPNNATKAPSQWYLQPPMKQCTKFLKNSGQIQGISLLECFILLSTKFKALWCLKKIRRRC